MNPLVDQYINRMDTWHAELTTLREIVLGCGLAEEIKWKQPCYCYEGGNVILLGTLKSSCVLSFLKGALLKDEQGLLTKAGGNTRAARVIRFTEVSEIDEIENVIEAYVLEAVEVEKAGLKIAGTKSSEPIPGELKERFANDTAFQTAFHALTPGRQRGYLLYFNQPKQSKTRTARIERSLPRILDGKAMNDCTCGLSRKMPACDGSHKQLR